MQKAAHGELARLSDPCAKRQGLFHDILEHDWRAMGRDFYDILGCVRVRLLKKSDNHFIDALTGSNVDKLTQDGSSGFRRTLQVKQGFDDLS
jgi:hypothetical protein